MRNFFNKIFFRSNNLDSISQNIKNLTNKTHVHKIFSLINSYSSDSEIRYVGGCIRKIISNEKVYGVVIFIYTVSNKSSDLGLISLNIFILKPGVVLTGLISIPPLLKKLALTDN